MQHSEKFMAEGMDALAEQDGRKALDWIKRFFAGAASSTPAPSESLPPTATTVRTSLGSIALSASEVETCRQVGTKLETYAENKARRRPSTKVPDVARVIQTKFGTVSLSASEIATCEETGAKLEVYAENKAFLAQGRGGRR